MPSPVLPSQFKATVAVPGDKLWQLIVKSVLKFPVLYWKWHRYAYKADGTWTEEYKKANCDAIASCRPSPAPSDDSTATAPIT